MVGDFFKLVFLTIGAQTRTMYPMTSFTKLFLKGEVLSGFWNSVVKGIGAVNSLIIVGALSVYQFGLYQLVLSLIAIAGALLPDMFDDIVFVEMSARWSQKKAGEAKALFGEYAALKILIGAVVTILVFAAGTFAGRLVHADIAGYIRILSAIPFIVTIQSLFLIFFRARVSFSGLPMDAVREASKLILFGIFFFAQIRLGIAEILYAYVGAQAAATIVIGILFARQYRAVFAGVVSNASARLFPILKRLGGWAAARYYIGQVSKSAKLWILRIFVSTEAVGLFSFASTLLSMIMSAAPFGTLGTLFPREIADRERFRHIFTRSTKYAIFISFAFMVLSIIGGPIAIHLIFPKYDPVIPLFIIMTGSIAVYGLFKVARMALIALQEQKALFVRLIAAAAADPLFIILLAPLFGIYGAGIGVVLVDALSAAVYYAALTRAHPHLRLTSKILFSFDAYDREFFGRMMKGGWGFLRNTMGRL